MEKLKESVENRLEYTEGFSYPIILFGMDILSMNKPARDYLAGAGAQNILSRAFVVERSQGKLPLNFFIETNKQPIPVRVFDDLVSAIEWSKQFRLT